MKVEKQGAELVLQADALNEQVVVAAALVSPEFRATAAREAPEVFLVPEHKIIWSAVRECVRLGLSPDPATLSRLSNTEVNVTYVAEILQARPHPPASKDLLFAFEQLRWDKQRHTVLTGPTNAFLESVRKGEEPARVHGLARAIASSLEGWGSRKHLLDGEELVRKQVIEIRERMSGKAVYPFGLKGLDYYEPSPGQDPKTVKRRILPGAAPGLVTVITGSTGSGKSTFTARLALGLMRQRRRVLYGAWEKSGGATIELLACMSLGWSRSDVLAGRLSEEQLGVFAQKMSELRPYVQFLENPFRRTRGEKLSNEHNLDELHGYIADSGCDIFIGDLFERCLVRDEPNEEKQALFRLQAMTEELRIHSMICAQQRKEIAGRPDPRPTVEGIKGSGAWAEIGDNILGIFRQSRAKPVPDNALEAYVLKQRDGTDMLAIEFDWDADRGMISGGRAIEFERTVSFGSSNQVDSFMRAPRKGNRS